VGSFSASSKFSVEVLASEDYTGEVYVIASFIFDITDCPSGGSLVSHVCSGHGQCLDVGTAYDGNYTCECEPEYVSVKNCSRQVIVDVQYSQNEVSYLISFSAPAATGGLILIAIIVFTVRRALKKASHKKDYHIFISYRFNTEADLARALCARLQAEILELDPLMKIRCYFDQQDIKDGTKWEVSFLTGLEHCCLFIPSGLNFRSGHRGD
jgi:hypothetical protein